MIFVPMPHYLQNKNSFSGNEDGMRYLITPGKRSVPDPDGGEEAKKKKPSSRWISGPSRGRWTRPTRPCGGGRSSR